MPPQIPANNTPTGNTTRTNNNLEPILSCGTKLRQILRVMRKISIHLKNKLSTPVERQAKTFQIRAAQTKLPRSVKHAQRIIFDQAVCQRARAISRMIIHHNNRKIEFIRKNLLKQGLYILGFIIGGQNNAKSLLFMNHEKGLYLIKNDR